MQSFRQTEGERVVSRGKLVIPLNSVQPFILLECQNVVVVTMSQYNFPPELS